MDWPQDNIQDLADAVHITYENTIKGDRLRSLLSHVVSWRYRCFIRHPAISQLMEVGDFALDVAKHMTGDIIGMECMLG